MVMVISLAIPPGVNSINRACRRQLAWLFVRARWRCRFANNFNT